MTQKVEAALLLVVPSGGAEGFETLHLGFDVVGPLEQHLYFGVRQSQPSVDVPALGEQRFLDGVEDGGPELDASDQVIDVDDEVSEAAEVRHEC